MTKQNKPIHAYIKYFVALLLFGFNGIVANYILLNSYEIVFLRTLIGCIFLSVIFVFTKGKESGVKNKKHFIYLIISGVAMGTSWMFLYEAYSEIGVSIATIAYYLRTNICYDAVTVHFSRAPNNPKDIGIIICLGRNVFGQRKCFAPKRLLVGSAMRHSIGNIICRYGNFQ